MWFVQCSTNRGHYSTPLIITSYIITSSSSHHNISSNAARLKVPTAFIIITPFGFNAPKSYRGIWRCGKALRPNIMVTNGLKVWTCSSFCHMVTASGTWETAKCPHLNDIRQMAQNGIYFKPAYIMV